MAEAEKVGKKHKKTLTIIGVVLVLVLAIAAGVGLRVLQRKDEVVQKTPTPALPKTVSNLEKLRDGGDQTAFNAELQKTLNDGSLDSETRYWVYIEQGHNAMQNHEWQAAVDAYSLALAIKQDKQPAGLLGDAYGALGNKEKAVEFYEKAIALVPTDNPRHDAIIEDYRSRIKAVQEGTQQL